MKAMKYLLLGILLMGVTAFARDPLVTGLVTNTAEANYAAAAGEGADALKTAILAVPTADLTPDESRYLICWAINNYPAKTAQARAAFAHSSTNAEVGGWYACTVGTAGNWNTYFNLQRSYPAGRRAQSYIRDTIRRAVTDAGSPDADLKKVIGDGELLPEYAAWFSGYLETLTPDEAVVELKKELRGLIKREDSEARTLRMRDIRGQLVLMRDVAGG